MCELIPEELALTIHNIFQLFWVVIVILLIVFILLDVIKILTSQDEKEIKNRQSLIIKRIIICIVIFLLVYLLQFLFSILNIPEASEALACAKQIIFWR